MRIIRAASNADEARTRLIERFNLTEIQARAIVEMRLRQLTGLEQDKLRAEYDEILKKIENYKALLADKSLRMALIRAEMEEVKQKYGDARKSEIEYSADGDFSIEDMIADEEVVVTISHAGYIKRTRLAEYRRQSRGGGFSRTSFHGDESPVHAVFHGKRQGILDARLRDTRRCKDS